MERTDVVDEVAALKDGLSVDEVVLIDCMLVISLDVEVAVLDGLLKAVNRLLTALTLEVVVLDEAWTAG